MKLDPYSEARLGEVHPQLSAKIHQMADMLNEEHITFRVIQGLRTWKQQADLYAQGRTAPGQIVTKAPPGHSWHQFGLAVDLVPIGLDGKADWNPSHPVWQRLVSVGTSIGLVAGAEFRTFKDYPHFQLTGKFPVSPDDEARQILTNQGMEAFWQETGITEDAEHGIQAV